MSKNKQSCVDQKVQMEVNKAQKKRSLQGMIYKLSQEAELLKDSDPQEYQSKIKRIEELKERMNGVQLEMNIKETRIKYGLTIKQVSDLTSIPYRSLQNWEAGIRKCPDYVENMVVTMIENTFGKPDHQMFLEELLEMFKSDSKHAKCEETKEYIENLIMDVSEHLNK